MRRLAADLDAKADAALKRGDLDEAARLTLEATKWMAAAAERDRLTGHHASDNVRKMTGTQLARRGRAVAAAKATTALHAACAGDARFGSLRRYAELRKIGRSSLNDYANGVAPCPEWVDRLVRKDFPTLVWDWPRGIVK